MQYNINIICTTWIYSIMQVNLIQQLCIIYQSLSFFKWWSDWQIHGEEWMAMSVATRGVRGEVGTTLWSPPGVLSHDDRQAWCHGTSHKHSHIDSRLTQADSTRKKKGGRQKFSVCPSWCERVGVSTTFFFLPVAPKPSATEHCHIPKHLWPYWTRVTVQ